MATIRSLYRSIIVLAFSLLLYCNISTCSNAKLAHAIGHDESKLCSIPKLPIAADGSFSKFGSIPTYQLTWAGRAASNAELGSIGNFREKISEQKTHPNEWLSTATDIELLRFLRAKNGIEEDAWKMIVDHAEWRVSRFGADSNFTQTFFSDSPLHSEVFWLGPNKENCPTLVIRTQIHNGLYYNEDPRVFTSFLVSVLEQGKKLYGIGINRQMCVLLDRAGTVFRNGKKKIEKYDLAVIPHLTELFRQMYHTFTNHYPDLVDYAKIAPASWFFSMCYKITSRVMDAETRTKFQMLKESEIQEKLHSVFDPSSLPSHLLGTSETYASSVDVLFDPSDIQFPEKETGRSAWRRTAH